MITAKEARSFMAKSDKAKNEQLEKIEEGIKRVCFNENFYIYQHTIPDKSFAEPLIPILLKNGFKAELINDTCISISWKN